MTDNAPFTFDPANDVHARALTRLASIDEEIGWFGSVAPDGMPHAVPVWYLWHDGKAVIMSRPKAAKVRNVRGNDKAVFHLEAGDDGEQLLVMQGIATISPDPASAWIDRIGAAYDEKYVTGLTRLNFTAATMALDYSIIIEFTPTHLIAW